MRCTWARREKCYGRAHRSRRALLALQKVLHLHLQPRRPPRSLAHLGRSLARSLLASPASPRRSPHTVGKLSTRRSFLGPEPHPTLAMRWATGAHPQRLEAPNQTGESLVATSYFSRAVRGYKSGLVRPAANQTKPASGATSGSAGVVRKPGSGSARCLRVKRRNPCQILTSRVRF